MTIGIIEDDRLLNRALNIALNKEGFETNCAYTYREGLRMAQERNDLLLLDISLPDGNGIELYREILKTRSIPAIFLTARDEEADMLTAFDAGADDYVVKPFPMKVLLKRVEAVLRRGSDQSGRLSWEGLCLYQKAKRVCLENREIQLTPKEYRLLEFMMEHRGQVLSKESILEHVWDIDGQFVGDNTVSVTVNRLKKKIEPDARNGKFISNVFGMGYRFGR